MVNYNTLEEFAIAHKPGEVINVNVNKVVDFGLIVDLGPDLKGLVHVSDVSLEDDPRKVMRDIKVGANIDVKILSVDTNKRRVVLGLKQLAKDHLE